MTALDDALNSAAVVYDAPTLYVDWMENPPSEPSSTNPDSIRDLSQQISGQVTVSQSLDDALPDPVTMTSGFDASGSITAEIGGREGITADTYGARSGSASGSHPTGATSGVTTHPTGIQHGDYEIVSVSIANTTAEVSLADAEMSLNAAYRWKLLAYAADNVIDVKTWVWGRHYYAGSTGLNFVISTSRQYTWTATAYYARTPDSRVVPFRPGAAITAEATSSTTSHSIPAATLDRAGFVVGIWTAAGGSGFTTAETELVDHIGVALNTMVAVTALKLPGAYAISATSSAASSQVTKIAIPLQIMNRPRMDALQFFSPFNSDSPVYKFDRDTAEMEFAANIITDTGPVSTIIYSGLMADVGVNGRSAELTGISKTRMNLDRSVTLPIVKGDRENCSIDWLANWLMARGGQFAGPGITKNTVFWAPMYGSLHAGMEPPDAYARQFQFTTASPFNPIGVRFPKQIADGPFVGGMFNEQTATSTVQTIITIGDLGNSREVFPHLSGTQIFADQLSLQNSKGRLTFWMRGDALSTAVSGYITSNYVMEYVSEARDASNTVIAGFRVFIRATDRVIVVNMYTGGGYSESFSMNLISGSLPTDNDWHFVGISWDWDNGAVGADIDNVENYYTNGTYATPNVLPTTDAAFRAAGGTFKNSMTFHLPVSDLQLELGPGAGPYDYTGFYEFYPLVSRKNATYRATNQPIVAIAESVPVQTWDTLAEAARASLSAYRIDELDNYNFLPPSYFGEPANIVASSVADTEFNAGDLNVRQDPSKIRNVVTIEYEEVRIAAKYTTVIADATVVEIPKGVSSITYPLDLPMSELHLSPFPNQPLTNLTAAQIATPSTIPSNIHYFSVNTVADGSGTVLSNIAVSAVISAYTASSITVTFTNKSNALAYLSNNGTDVPFIRLLGYPLTVTTAYTTVRDQASLSARRERQLTVQMPWIQDRSTAELVAQRLLLALSRPRAEVTVKVTGDPRRKPGQLVTIQDSQGTQASGRWRILAIDHSLNGAEYTQTLSLLRVYPIAVWDGVDGWDNANWGV